MRRALIALLVVILFIAVWLAPQSVAQDTDAERIAALETAVADLTSRVATLESSPSAGAGEEGTARFTLKGTIEFPFREPGVTRGEGVACTGGSLFPDLSVGADISVLSAEATVIGIGRLDEGTMHKPERATTFDCRMAFTVEDLPRSSFYTINMGRRGDITFSFDDLEESDWNVSLVLD